MITKSQDSLSWIVPHISQSFYSKKQQLPGERSKKDLVQAKVMKYDSVTRISVFLQTLIRSHWHLRKAILFYRSEKECH